MTVRTSGDGVNTSIERDPFPLVARGAFGACMSLNDMLGRPAQASWLELTDDMRERLADKAVQVCMPGVVTMASKLTIEETLYVAVCRAIVNAVEEARQAGLGVDNDLDSA